MLPDRVSNLGPLTYESGALLIALRGPAMICDRRLLSISYKNHITSEEVRKNIQAAITEYDELLTLVQKRRLRWLSHFLHTG